jgi:hypothetical protein
VRVSAVPGRRVIEERRHTMNIFPIIGVAVVMAVVLGYFGFR